MKKLLIAISLFCSLASSMASAQTVTHIIYVIKENRSFDNYFGTFKGYSTPAGWQGVQSYCSGGSSPVYPNQAVCHYGNPTNECSSYGGDCPEPISFSKYSGNPYSLYLEDAATTYADVSHAHSQLLSYNDNGLQDAYPTTGCPNSGGTATVNPCGYAYFDGAQIGPESQPGTYYYYARKYGLSDNFFATSTPSSAGHFYIFAGQDHGLSDDPDTTALQSGKSCYPGATINQGKSIAGVACTTNSACASNQCGCPSSVCPGSSAGYWNGAWTCGAKHTGTSYPFTYTGSWASSVGTPSSVNTGGGTCTTGHPDYTSPESPTACTTNAGCTVSSYLYCTYGAYRGGICSTKSTQSCVCYGVAGNPGANVPSTCSDASDCGAASPTCSTTSSIQGAAGSPCPTLTTIADQAQLASVSLKYYNSSQWNAATYASNLFFSQWFASNVFGENQFLTDAATVTGGVCSGHTATSCGLDSSCSSLGYGTCVDPSSSALPEIVFVGPGEQNNTASDHPSAGPVSTGMQWTAAQVAAVVGNCTAANLSSAECYLWNHSIIFVTWDDSGGFWDHVPQPVLDGLNFGNRVPLLAISPFAVNGINHCCANGPGGTGAAQPLEAGSVLRCMEQIFSITPIGSRDTTANDACFGTGTKASPGTGANAGMINLSQTMLNPPAASGSAVKKSSGQN
jgi:hypothetical protein